MKSLENLCILLLEDEYFLSLELEDILAVEGAVVEGPYADLEDVMKISLAQVDGAILNVNIRNGTSYPFAHRLRERNIPFIFVSGQDRRQEPKEWHQNIWVSKPYEAREIVTALVRLLGRPA